MNKNIKVDELTHEIEELKQKVSELISEMKKVEDYNNHIILYKQTKYQLLIEVNKSEGVLLLVDIILEDTVF